MSGTVKLAARVPKMPRERRVKAPKCPAAIFKPHPFKNKVSFVGAKPTILLTEQAHDLIWHIVDQSDEEVGWLGTVKQVGNDYLIEEIILFKQEVNAATNTLFGSGLSAVGMEILKRPGGREIWNSIRFWGHSHGDWATEPSQQDEDQFLSFRKSGHPFFIRGIFNRAGSMKFSIFYFDAQVRIDDVPWQVVRAVAPDLAAQVKAELAVKVSKKAPVPKGKGQSFLSRVGQAVFNQADDEPDEIFGYPRNYFSGSVNPLNGD